jgi:ATP-dependent Clp protease ATP-binding subunit ClpA
MPQTPRMKNSGRDLKDAKDEKKKLKNKKRGGPKDDDDVDENGNIEGLIDYDDVESDSDESEASLTKSELHRLKKYGKLPESVKNDIRGGRSPRKAALKAREAIRKKLKKEDSRNKSPSTDSTYEDEPIVKRKKGFGFVSKKKFVESESEDDGETLGSEDTDEEEEEDEDEEEEEEEEDEEEEDEEEEFEDKFKGISISIGGGGGFDESDRMIPKRHNMKKESADVRKFVEMVTKPIEENNIDEQIDQFKALDSPKKRSMLEALEKRSEYVKKEEPLMFRLLQMKLQPEMMAMVMSRYNALNTMDPSSGEYYKLRAWMEKLVSMPLGNYKEMPVRLEDGSEACTPFMNKARRCLDDAIYGQDEAKLQIMQFIASKIANPTASGLSLLLMGPPGIGKTSLIKNGIAKALEWPFQFISLGGDSDATTYTGHQFVYEGSHCGRIANCLAQAKSMSMVLMFDELDKISATPKGEEVQNLLVHMTDPVQNMEFEDKYLSGIPLDLSRTMLVFSGNDINRIDKVLLDRMVVVQLAGYQPKDKISIAEQFLLPSALKEVNLGEKVAISRDILQHVLDNYAKEETGVRELKRCIEQIVQRINMLRMFNVKELPFHIPGFQLPFVIKKEHVDLFLKKKEVADKMPYGMYT